MNIDGKQKTVLVLLSKIDTFSDVFKKLTVGDVLSTQEKSYILSCAILFRKGYSNDMRFKTYLEISYYIILKYSISYSDFKPLYDFTTNFGFYPISSSIIRDGLVEDLNIDYALNYRFVEWFNEKDDFIETYEQKVSRLQTINSRMNNVAFIAPTSFGKSSVITECIINNINNYSETKIGIIVPSKSLLMQTFRMIRDMIVREGINTKLIIHDEMYSNEDGFIGILTQERATRLLKKYDISFDYLFIDEAHKILDYDSRSLLLTRMIRTSKVRNEHLKIYYLSPLVNESKNLLIGLNGDEVSEQKVSFNIKEPDIYYFDENKNKYMYNRFVNKFYHIREYDNELSYIIENSGQKNYLYISTPKAIEDFSIILSLQLDIVEDTSIEELNITLSDLVHEDFDIIDCLKKGVIYLHGKIPDTIKDYLEYKFKQLPSIKFLIANNVILEGINMPIDTQFIIKTYHVKKQDLVNLIGRVNRLNNIFENGTTHYRKLLPQIHFVHISQYPDKNLKSLISKLRSSVFEDKIKNPILDNFDESKLNQSEKNIARRILKEDNFLTQNHEDLDDGIELLHKYLIENNIIQQYDNQIRKQVVYSIYNKIQSIGSNSNWLILSITEKIHYIFINGIPNNSELMNDFNIFRLDNTAARSFYEMHISDSFSLTLKQKVIKTYAHFKQRIEEGEPELYFGGTYGEIPKSTDLYEENGREVYIDLSGKSNKELINLAIVKIGIEDDYVSYHLNKLIVFLKDFNLITESEYNTVMYGTTDESIINLIRLGLSPSLISKLINDNQIQNISVDMNGNLTGNDAFMSFRNTVGDYYQFEISRFFNQV